MYLWKRIFYNRYCIINSYFIGNPNIFESLVTGSHLKFCAMLQQHAKTKYFSKHSLSYKCLQATQKE